MADPLVLNRDPLVLTGWSPKVINGWSPKILKYSEDQPRDERGRFGSGGGGGNAVALTRMAEASRIANEHVTAHGDSQAQHDHVEGVKGSYTPERAALHEQILNEAMAKVADVPRDRQAIMLGGIPGAGKSSSFGTDAVKALGIDPHNFATVNPDDFKAALVEAGAVTPVQGLKPAEAAPVVHEESADLAAQFASRLMEQGTNVNYDITMGSRNSVQSRLDALRAAGYAPPDMIFVDTEPKIALDRAAARFGHQMVTPSGGRTVSEDFIAKVQAGIPLPNRGVFESVKAQSGRWALFDNSGSKIALVSQGVGTGATKSADRLSVELAKLAKGWQDQGRQDHGQFGTGTAGRQASDRALKDFRSTFEKAMGPGNPFTNHVSHYSATEMRAQGMVPLTANGGKTGVLVHDHGDGRIEATALYNVSDVPGAGRAILKDAIDNHGVNYVECYGPVLPELYKTLGFQVSERFPFDPSQAAPTWDYAQFDHPDYVTMRLPPKG
ncbi:MAG: zeta toxin family protein [Pseudomonadota bacterium]